ncbi:hypothetical protein [Rhizobium oryzicola]|uniref:Uncharacterized protein n=1 Tax=Rhizobium oryzicola TaxID=1232668 RepID=A0ABT8SR49_9HYPH|nr:hypothetical protein [Rhizobium oryzicola]MDO1580903.1 hypothetical protein [Rhizobium oryzicola]
MGIVIDLAGVYSPRNYDRAQGLRSRLLQRAANDVDAIGEPFLEASRQAQHIERGLLSSMAKHRMRTEIARELADGGSVESGVLVGCQRVQAALELIQDRRELIEPCIASLLEDARVARWASDGLRAMAHPSSNR